MRIARVRLALLAAVLSSLLGGLAFRAHADVPNAVVSNAAVPNAAVSNAAQRALRMAYPEPGTLHNLMRRSRPEKNLCRAYLFPPLLDLDPDTLELVPTLAESLPEISADGRTLTFTLREGVYWQRTEPGAERVPVSTEDVRFSFELAKDPSLDAATLRSVLTRFERIEVLDARSFRVHLSEPYHRAVLDFGTEFSLMPAHLLARDPEGFRDTKLARAPIGYGPYRVTEWVAGSHLTLERDPDWTALEGRPWNLARIHLLFLTDSARFRPLFEAGELDLAAEQDPLEFRRAQEDPALRAIARFVDYTLPQWNFVVWNQTNPLFADVRVREALSLALPAERARDAYYAGEADLPTGPFAAGAPEIDPAIPPVPFDPDRAEALLAEAGFGDSDQDGVLDRDGQPFRFSLLRSSTVIPPLDRTLELYRTQLRQLGVTMEIERLEFAALVARLRAHEFEAAQVARTPDPRDDDLFPFLHSSQADGGNNFPCFADAECDRLLERFRATFDADARTQIGRALHRRVRDRFVYTYLPTPRSLVYVSRDLEGVEVGKTGLRIDRLRFSDERP